MRNICEVITKIKSKIPNERHVLHQDLTSLLESLKYMAPEILQSHIPWGLLAEALNMRLNPENSAWEKEIQSIFADQETI